MTSGLWSLDHDAAALDAAAQAWTSTAETLTGSADRVNAGAQAALGTGWEGISASTYAAHRSDLLGDVDTGAALALRAARSLEGVASSVRGAQSRLDASWAVIASVPHTGTGDSLEFQPEDDAQQLLVTAAIDEATRIRSELDTALLGDVDTLGAIATEWAAVADGTRGFVTPPDAAATGVLLVDGVAVVNTGSGDDVVEVHLDPDTGETIVTVNGVPHRMPDGVEVLVRGGENGDDITVLDGISDGVTVLAGHGDDTVTGGAAADVIVAGAGDDDVTGGSGGDRVFGGDGQDYLDGQGGDDLVDGGDGQDTVYGLGGRDTLSGGAGDDYVEGGVSADVVHGGVGDDTVSGGTGEDRLLGGAGEDVLYAGRGGDEVHGGDGSDTAYVEEHDDVSGAVGHEVEIPELDLERFVTIEGSPEFQARIRADLAFLASSPAGQELLVGLEDGLEIGAERSITIRETEQDGYLRTTDGNHHELGIRPNHDDLRGYTPPSVVLQHELAHLYDQAHGLDDDDEVYEGDEARDVGEDEGERVATGLPIDADDDPDTAEVLSPDHPYAATENGLRDELGLPQREYYDGDPSDG